jgi:hypothetical protein
MEVWPKLIWLVISALALAGIAWMYEIRANGKTINHTLIGEAR